MDNKRSTNMVIYSVKLSLILFFMFLKVTINKI